MTKKTIKDGLLVIFDGIDGTGKTTQLGLTFDKLNKLNWKIHKSRNLGGTPIGEDLRDVLLKPTPRPVNVDLYITVAIQEALINKINQERKDGSIILLDRGPLSLVAYQSYGSGADKSLGWKYATQGMSALKPDLIILYTADTEIAVKRARKVSKAPDYFESKPIDFFKRVESGFTEAREKYNIFVIDANQSIEDVHINTMDLINKAIELKLKQS